MLEHSFQRQSIQACRANVITQIFIQKNPSAEIFYRGIPNYLGSL